MNTNEQARRKKVLLQLLEEIQKNIEVGDIAIIGMSGHYPQAENLQEYWENLKNGRDCITPVPKTRWDVDKYYNEDRKNPNTYYTRYGGFLEGIDKFDPMFFNISQVEAEVTDPQERIFLETAWEAIEDSGYTRNNVNELSQNTGVFVGVMNGNYDIIGGEEWAKSKTIGANSATWSIANRISYFFNLQGPSMAVNTACSSSLTAIHLAVNSIQKGECDMAIAGGVNLILHPAHFARLCKMEMLSGKEYLSAFGDDADGFVDGEGAGAIILKSLKKALEDNDQIYGVIKGSSINAGGKTSGYTVPNPKAQSELIERAIQNADIDPRTISYMEAHGTGTKLGDPIEVRGLSNVYEKYTKDRQFCAIGSVKANIGHLESAAGIAGVHKILLQMKHKKLVPSIHAENVNPEIDFEESPFQLQKDYVEWKRPSVNKNGIFAEVPRRAGISSFGAGGSNVHMILEEFEQEKRKGSLNGYSENVLILSARDQERLLEYAGNVKKHFLQLEKSSGLDELYSLQTGREFMEERLAIVGKSMSDILNKLTSYCNGERNVEGIFTGSVAHQRNRSASANQIQVEEAYRRKDIRELAKLWINGDFVDFRKLYNVLPNRVTMPFYPFAREQCWIEVSDQIEHVPQEGNGFQNVSDINGLCMEIVLSEEDKYIKDHVVGGNKIVPAAMQMELVTKATKQLIATSNVVAIQDTVWGYPIIIEGKRKIKLKFRDKKTGYLDYQIVTDKDGEQELIHSKGTVRYQKQAETIKNINISELLKNCTKEVSKGELYDTFNRNGYQYGTNLSVIEKAYVGEKEAVSYIHLPESGRIDFTAVIDGAFQTLALVRKEASEEMISMPLALGNIIIREEITTSCYVYVRPETEESFSLCVAELNGTIAIEMQGMKLSKVKTKTTQKNQIGSKQQGFESAVQLIQELIHNETKIQVEKLKLDTELDKFGIDSVMIMRFTTELEEKLGDVSRTLFFEKRTIRELADYLCAEFVDYFSGKNITEVVEFEQSMDLQKSWMPESMEESQTRTVESDEIAIIGLDGRYPMADDLDEFWKNLCEGKDCITEIGNDRWNHDNYYSEDKKALGKTYTKWGGFITDYDKFDPLFFNISPIEAEMMDPQERVFLESSWKAVEDAGYSKTELSKSTVGVFVGAMYGQYQMIGAEQYLLGNKVAPLSNFSTIANRVSYFMDLRGPSMAVDTMCSSSLTSVYLACEAIKNGDCEMAIAGGVNLSIHPSKYVLLSSTKFMASDGRCRSFGEGGDGYVPGEGVGAVLLKPLKKAEADGDHIYGVIKGAALNHEGKTNGYTVPDPVAQSKVIKKALERSGIDAATVSCIEAHGTGTQLGDPIEINGLNYAFKEYTEKEHFCAVGSVKSNIGHLESAAGIAAITKVLLEMKYKKIVPSIHSERLNPIIKFDHTAFYVPQQLEEWKGVEDETGRIVRRAGISGFGAGGSNAHIIIEEYQPKENKEQAAKQETYIIPVSARDKVQLQEAVKNLKRFLEHANVSKISENNTMPHLKDCMKKDITAILTEILDIALEGIRGDMTFIELDMEEISLFRLAKHIGEQYGIDVTVENSTMYDTIDNFIGKLIASDKEQLEMYYGIEATAATESGDSLADIAFTLQVGREAMQERVCFVVKNQSELKELADAYLRGEADSASVYECDEERGDVLLEELNGRTKEEYTKQFIQERHYNKVAFIWSNGADVDWNALYANGRPSRISLPTYPFAKERIWISNMISNSEKVQLSKADKLHPILDANESTLYHQRFVTRFDEQSEVLKAHKVYGKHVIPGAAFLEMGRAAGELAMEGDVLEISNLNWCHAAEKTGETLNVVTEIQQEKDAITYTISDKDNGILYSNGVYGKTVQNCEEQLDVEKLEEIKSRYNGEVRKEEYYKLLSQAGLEYGKELQLIEEVFVIDDKRLFARLSAVKPELRDEKYKLNPFIMDAAFQCVCAVLQNESRDEADIPIGIEKISIYEALPEECCVYIEAGPANSKRDKFDIYMINETGKIYVKIHNFTLGVVGGKKNRRRTAKKEKLNTVYLRKDWLDKTILDYQQKSVGKIAVFDIGDGFLENLKNLLGERTEGIISIRAGRSFCKVNSCSYEINPGSEEDIKCMISSFKDEGILPSVYIHRWSLDSSHTSITDNLQRSVYVSFYLCKAIMRACKHVKFLYFYDGCDKNSYACKAGMNGFVRTVNQEKKDYLFKAIDLNGAKDIQAKLAVDEVFIQDKDAIAIQYKENKRLVEQIIEVKEEIPTEIKMKDNGVYVIVGGIGGIGYIIAQYFAERGNINLVLSGRRQHSNEIEQKLEQLRMNRTNAEYFSGDISKEKDTYDLISYTKQRFGKVDGIISCAGIIKDARILNKTEEEFSSVVNIKTLGTYWIDEATKDESLDFFFICSSLAGAIGNAGQADYAYGNSFIDAFIRNRELQVARGERHGVSRSINWPFWKDGGMQLNESSVEWLRTSMGMEPLSTKNGLQAFFASLSMKYANMIVLEGDREKIKQAMGVSRPKQENVSDYNPVVKEKMNTYLIEMLSELVKLEPKRIKAKTALEEYGINSLLILEWTEKMESVFGSLSKTLFFEYQTIDELSEYFCKNFNERVMKLFFKSDNAENKVTYVKEERKQSIPANHSKKAGVETVTADSCNRNQEDDIAIIGIAGKYPMADNLEEFWENLKLGKDCITKIPADRWDCEENYDKKRGIYGKVYCKEGGFLREIDKFDSMFFHITPSEAEFLDPQERLMLETAWHAMEDAGYTKADMSNKKVGVFTGVMSSQYQLLGLEKTLKGEPSFPGAVYASISNRISYILNLRGPSITLDTMCSSALTALHLACQSIRLGESEMAFVGGVNLMVHSSKYRQLCANGFMASDGRCHSFGNGGDGYGASEGVGVALVKSLKKAVEDGDYIYGIIKSTAVNHDGKTNGYTVPNPNAQCEVVKEALQKAHISAETIGYLEAHGTGTPLGDPIEITGLSKAYADYGTKKQFCPIGSVKSNMGHAESAAGMAALSKVLLQMKNQQLVPSIHSEVLNPNINFEQTPFYVQRKLEDWNTTVSSEDGQKIPRRAGISAFGAGGVNAHVIVEEYGNRGNIEKEEQTPQIFVFSASKLESLKRYLVRFQGFLKKNSDISFSNMAYTLQVGRERMEVRAAIVASDYEGLLEKLSRLIKTEYVECENEGIFISKKKENLTLGNTLEGLINESMIEKMYQGGEYNQLAALWIKGFDIPWRQLYCGKNIYRIPLPGYEFIKTRCWINEIPEGVNMEEEESGESNETLQEEESSENVETIQEEESSKNINEHEERTESIEDIVLTIISEIGKIPKEEINVEEDLYEYGFDSIIALKVVQRMGEKLGITVDVSELLEVESIEELFSIVKEYIEESVSPEEKMNKDTL